MSLENAVAQATQELGLSREAVNGIVAVAAQQIALVGAEYTNRIAGLAKEVWVDAVVGIDTNPGTEASPVKTLGKAISMVPPGGRVTIRLLSDYELTVDTGFANRQVLIKSAETTRKVLTFSRYSFVFGATTYSAIRSIWLWDGASLECDNVKIVMPPVDGAWAMTSISNYAAFRVQMMTRLGGVPYVGLYSCEISIPATPYAPLFDRSGTLMAVMVLSALVSGQALNGRLFADATNTAGTATTGLSWLLTNLATI